MQIIISAFLFLITPNAYSDSISGYNLESCSDYGCFKIYSSQAEISKGYNLTAFSYIELKIFKNGQLQKKISSKNSYIDHNLNILVLGSSENTEKPHLIFDLSSNSFKKL